MVFLSLTSEPAARRKKERRAEESFDFLPEKSDVLPL
jgi:hypothetical protein